MVLLLSLTAPSFRGIVIWLRAFLRHTSGYLKACLRLMFALAWNPSTRFYTIEGNEGERKTSASSWASSCAMTPNVESHGPASCGVPEAGVMASAQNPATESPRNLALTDMYTTNFAASTEVENENQAANIELRPILALSIQEKRYERDPIQLPQNYSYSAPPGIPDFSEKIDDAWQPITHPEGALFFYGTRKRVVTEADVTQGAITAKIETAINMLCNLLTENITIPATAELVLDVNEDSNICGYYFVDHDSKSLFWVESHKQLLPEIFEMVPATRKSHIKYAYERQYWIHCDLFPNKRIVQADIMVRLKCMIMHAYAETVTTETSLTPYSVDDLSSLMTLMGPLNESVGETHEHSICIIARLMDTFTQSQFINFCGQPAARLDVDKPLLHQQEKEPKWKMLLLYFLNIAFFGSLQSHKQSIERVWVDEAVVATRWRSFFDSLKAEWTGFTVFSTVMLAVDVSFLAVPGVNPNSVQSQPASQVLTYLSTLCAMGSLISSLILASQIQALRGDNVDGAGTLLLGMSNSLLGLDGLALIHGLPFSLLIWAMIFFTIALSTTMFHSTALVTLGVVGSIFALVMLLTGWLMLAINDLHISSLIRSSSEV